jgi:hypothetical protein
MQAARHMGSHYFDNGTRSFFRSRVLGWSIMHDGEPYAPWGFMVRESKGAGFDVSDGRAYAVSVWCRFGSLVATLNATADGIPVQDYEGKPLSRIESERLLKSKIGVEAARLAVAACVCHGCCVWGDPWMYKACESCDAPAGESCRPGCLGVTA